MSQEEIEKKDKEILVRLVEYCKYLYEEEKERTNRLNNAVKIYIAFLTFILGIGILKVLPFEKVLMLGNSSSVNKVYAVFVIVLFFGSIVLFLSSFIFTILVLKIWRFERLCDPQKTAIESILIESENKLLSLIIADYVIAGNRNYVINEKKAKLLSKALFSILAGFILFSITLVIFWKGGN